MRSPDGCWIGVDPGGDRKFGVAFVSALGEVVGTHRVSFADQAVALIEACPLGAGVDAPLWWSSGKSSDRLADQWIRGTYKIPSGTVQAANSLRGAALVQAAMFVFRLREKFPGVPITEAHPKAVAMAFGGWDKATEKFGALGVYTAGDQEHERDAVLAAFAAREGYSGRWTINLAQHRSQSEQDPSTFWLAPIDYFWPELDGRRP